MPRIIFKLLWENIQKGKEIVAYVKNLSKDGAYYWVIAYVSPSFNGEGKIVGYHSVRLKPKIEAVSKIEKVYSKLISEEKEGGIAKSQAFLENLLKKEGVNYEEYILSL
ncbi:PAS domain-containing protein [Helicobacter burdigaliensis]